MSTYEREDAPMWDDCDARLEDIRNANIEGQIVMTMEEYRACMANDGSTASKSSVTKSKGWAKTSCEEMPSGGNISETSRRARLTRLPVPTLKAARRDLE